MSAKKTKYSWSQFHWDDWRNDAALQSCDLATKGLWMDLLVLMFNSERQGYLQVNDQQMSSLYLSKKTGVDKRTIEKKLQVLIAKKVCSVDENGIIYSRRMARENASVQQVSSNDTVSVQDASGKFPVNLQVKIAEDSQNSDALNKRRIDKNREDNPPLSSLSENEQTLLNKSINLLVQATKLPEQKITLIVNQSLEKLGGDCATLRGYIDKSLLTAVRPLNYLHKLVNEHGKPSNVHPFPNLKQTTSIPIRSSWAEVTGDKAFDKLSGNDQGIVRLLQKGKTSDWMMKFYENHNPSAWNYYQKQCLGAALSKNNTTSKVKQQGAFA